MKTPLSDPNQAVTIFSSIVISRGNPKEEVSEIDLENYIAQAIWKFFDRHRREASRRLMVGELDLVLNDARIVSVRIDGHRVLNPHGFTGKEIEICLGGTLTKRGDDLEPAPLFEPGTTMAYILSKEKDLSEMVYVDVLDEKTKVFLVTPNFTSYLDEFDWGRRDLFETLASQFNVFEEVAQAIYLKYLEGKTSSRMGRIIREGFDNAFQKFLKILIQKISQAKDLHSPPTVFIRNLPLPADLHRRPISFGRRRIKILRPDDEELNNLVNDYIYNSHNDLNLLARKRLKWLISSSA